MGYNTRRVSLSLPDLGVALPKRSRAQSHPSPPNTIVEGDESERPAKISKKSHGSSASPPPPRPSGLMSPPRTTMNTRAKQQAQELSPPPSPAAEGGSSNKIDVEGINDDIVVATIRQLESTGNRPIFVKELAAVLATSLHSVEKSANPSALISSRLTAYLNRSWPAISPCPLAKDLSTVHPRRLYFYLTTTTHQPVPEYVEPHPHQPLKPHRVIISPSLSSASAADEEEEDDRYNRTRQALSPSPEVDLSSPELEDDIHNTQEQPPITPGAPFSGRNSVSLSRERSASASVSISNLAQHHRMRAASPQLEHEERDFKQTASALFEQAQQQRRNSQQSSGPDVVMEAADASAGAEREASTEACSREKSVTFLIEGEEDGAAGEEEESEESLARKNSEAASALFGAADYHHLEPGVVEHHNLGLFSSSPLIQPTESALIGDIDSVMASAPHSYGAAGHGGFGLKDTMEHLTLDLKTNDSNNNNDQTHSLLPAAAHSHSADMERDLGMFAAADWETLRSPENVELAELEDLFDAY